MNNIFFISNCFRKPRIQSIIDAGCFGVFNLISDITTQKMTYWVVRKIYYNIKMCISDIIVISDIDGYEFLNNFYGLRYKKILLLMWNSELELNGLDVSELKSKYKKLTVGFFFADAAIKANESFGVKSKHLISPVLPYNIAGNLDFENQIVYCAEVSLYPELLNGNAQLDNHIWEYGNKILTEGISLLFNTELIANNFKDFTINFDMKLVLKDRIRYLYVQKLKEIYKDDFLLVGNDWISLGFDAMPSNYDLDSLLKMYSKSKIGIDLLSKSSDEALFERSLQLISTSNGFLQLQTIDSVVTYSQFSKERTFATFEELIFKIDFFLNLEKGDYLKKGKEFRDYLEAKNISYV